MSSGSHQLRFIDGCDGGSRKAQGAVHQAGLAAGETQYLRGLLAGLGGTLKGGDLSLARPPSATSIQPSNPGTFFLKLYGLGFRV